MRSKKYLHLNKKHKLICLFAIVVLFSGCRSSFQANWQNFNAYYNTYYNAKKSYNAGLKKNLGQVREYNPLQPIRVHETPVNAGAQDFDKAIEKGADVLRKYKDTKWVGNALGLIGKSYYFKKDYFSAEQKFNELFATSQDPELQQQAIVWRGRVLLDMELYNEGIAYLTEQLTLFDEELEKSNRAEIQALLAQHYVRLESWELARKELSEAIPNLSKKEFRERGYFLLGQIYERLGDTSSAYDAYDKVQDNHTEYRLQYLANRKKAEVARELDRHDIALALFDEMVRDDKNIDYKAELDFELARTEQRKGNYTRAEQVYKNLLRNELSKPLPEIAARTYYGLAEIYRYDYDDFTQAAAYYDSAAQKNVPAERLPENFVANELAESFGEYARLKSEIALKDSLLWLGQLPPDEFDSVMVELREKKVAELKELQRQSEDRQNMVVNADQGVEEEDATSLRNGFLNSDNPVLQQNTKLQFLANWGDRPLVDNWRVASMIRASRSSEDSDEDVAGSGEEDSEMIRVEIDVSPIPFTEQQQDSLLKRIAADEYQLGNLFFLSLNMPDSAAYYFQRAIDNPSREDINIVSLYSLSELYSIIDDEEKSRMYAFRLMEEYPATDYARRMGEKFGIELKVLDESASIDPKQIYNLMMEEDSTAALVKAEKLKQFSQSFKRHEIAPQAQYDAIELYLELGKQDSLYEEKMNDWISETRQWEEKQEAFRLEKDSAQVMLQDTTLTDEEREELVALEDSSLIHPDFSMIFPYIGEHWDSARSAIDVFLENFEDTKLTNRVLRLQEELKLDGDRISEMEEVEDEVQDSVDQASEYYNCTDLNAELEVRGGMDQFMGNVNLPDKIEVFEITYSFLVNQRGIIDEFTLQTDDVPDDVNEAFDNAINSYLSFEPIIYEGQAVPARCEITFPVN